MRFAVAILGLAGCRSLLGFDDVVGVDDATAIDSPTDALTDALTDVPPDMPLVTCPDDYLTITGGEAGHKYKAVAQADWVTLSGGCATSGGYLAIPNNATEYEAITTLASPVAWVGVTDQVNEGSIVDSLNNAYAALPVSNNAGARDCGVARDPDPPVEFEQCGNNHPGVCECEE